METKIARRILLGFIEVHVLHHAAKAPFYGSWMMAELAKHGYQVGPSMMYPLLRSLEEQGLLVREDRLEDGKIRKYYQITLRGRDILAFAKKQLAELTDELFIPQEETK
ncbi:MAG: PadR family transcriptional regulator [Bacillus subtilis]|nr:PadR family transcriptional regulator [Bacillus subtilis]